MASFKNIATASALLAALGSTRIAWYHFFREDLRGLRAARAARIDDRYRGVSSLLPPRGTVVYLSDAALDSEEGARLYLQALYSLSPRILIKDDRVAQAAIANLRDVRKLDELARSSGFRVVKVFDGGVALLERGPR